MNLQKSINRIIELFGIFQYQVKSHNQVDQFDINKLAEDVLLPVFKEAFQCKFLMNLNREKRNYAGLDLGDHQARVAFQITSESSIEKMKDALRQVVAHKHYLRFDTVYIYILKQKQQKYTKKPLLDITKGVLNFDPEKHIIDSQDVIRKIRDLDYEIIQRIQDTLEIHFSQATKYFIRPHSPKKLEDLILNLLPIELPDDLYIGKLTYDRDDIIDRSRENEFFLSRRTSERSIVWAALRLMGLVAPCSWVVRSRELITFHNLRDENLSLAKLVEPTISDPIPWRRYIRKDNGELDIDHLNILKELLRTTFQAQIWHRGITWQHEERLFMFISRDRREDGKLKEIRKEAWSRGKKEGRIVYQVHWREDNPTKIKYHEHLAFRVGFNLYDDQWHLAITPDWLCSYNGYKKSWRHKSRISFLKRKDHNNDVLENLLFIIEILKKDQKEILADSATGPRILLGDLTKLGGSPPIDDIEWLQHDEKRKRKALEAKVVMPLYESNETRSNS